MKVPTALIPAAALLVLAGCQGTPRTNDLVASGDTYEIDARLEALEKEGAFVVVGELARIDARGARTRLVLPSVLVRAGEGATLWVADERDASAGVRVDLRVPVQAELDGGAEIWLEVQSAGATVASSALSVEPAKAPSENTPLGSQRRRSRCSDV